MAGAVLSGVEHVLVVVPSRNEALLIGQCLDSVLRAAALVDVPVSVVVALDGCTDGTAEVVARFPSVLACAVDLANVGLVRSAGVQAGLAELQRIHGSGFDPSSVWLANTDADTRVPLGWLRWQLELAADGYDLAVGTCEPDPADVDVAIAALWLERHRLAEGHEAVHGANLGIRASTYLSVGGFAALPTGEDVDLVARVRDAGWRWISTDRARVRTSGRRIGRAPEGFAHYLTELDALTNAAAGPA